MPLDRDSLSPLRRTILELNLLLAFSLVVVAVQLSLNTDRQTMLITAAWLAGLLGLWMLIALVDFVMRHVNMGRLAQRERKGGFARRRSMNYPMQAPHPHPELSGDLPKHHGRRAAR